MTETIRQTLPAIYHGLLSDFFDAPAVPEEKATCDDCAMCAKGDAPAGPDVVFFKPEVKCCTFQPHLPNYLVGSILLDENPGLDGGRRRLRDKLLGRLGVTPQWVAPPRKWSLLFEASRESSFGRSSALRCPYFEPDGGLCTIWKHRESACGTFFCKHGNGADSKAFWSALEAYLRHVERTLSRHAVQSIAPGLAEPKVRRGQLTLEDLEDRAPHEARYREIWGAFEGREEAFYAACHACISGLSRADFERIVGVQEGPHLFSELARSHGRLRAPKLAERLMLNPDLTTQPVPGGVLVTTYSRYEPVLLNEQLYEVVKEFTGKESVAEVKERLARDHEVELSEAMLLSLQQFRVVIPA